MGRLWHTLLLSKWNPIFAWLSIESIIHDQQREYYDAINASNNVTDSTVFIGFMHTAIKTSLIEAISAVDGMSDEPMSKEAARTKAIEQFLT